MKARSKDATYCLSSAARYILSKYEFCHTESVECMKSELDLFQAPAPRLVWRRQIGMNILPPASTLTDNGPLEFYVSGAGNEYIDLMHTNLYLQALITKADGTELVDADVQVGSTNYFLSSLFSQVEVTLNGKTIGHSNALHPYRSMIEVLTQFSPNLNRGFAQTAFFQKDTPNSMGVTQTNAPNPEIYIENFDIDRNMLDGIVMSDGDDLDKDHEEAAVIVNQPLRRNQGLYWRSRFSKDSQWLEQVNLLLGQLPQEMVIAFVDNDAQNGNYKKNPYNFKHMEIRYVVVKYGRKQLPSQTVDLQFQPQ